MPRSIKRSFRDVLHPVLLLDGANTAAALGDALMGADDLAWAPNITRDLFALTLPDEQLARAAQRMHRVGVELVAEYNETEPDRRTAEITAGRGIGMKVILLASYLLRDLPLNLIDATGPHPAIRAPRWRTPL